MQQLSLRGFDKELERKLREVAKHERVSLNRAALLLMRRGAGLARDGQPPATVAHSLDRFVGRWSEVDEKRLLDGIAACEAVDEALWK